MAEKKPPAPRPFASQACYAHEVDPGCMWAPETGARKPGAKKAAAKKRPRTARKPRRRPAKV